MNNEPNVLTLTSHLHLGFTENEIVSQRAVNKATKARRHKEPKLYDLEY